MLQQLTGLLSRLQPAPDEWFADIKVSVEHREYLPPLPCDNYEELVQSWRQAMYWTDSLDVALSAMLAVVASTELQGSQIWLRLIGPAGSAKTTLCEAVSTNLDHTFPMSLLTGLHSGYTGAGAGDDASLIPKINGKTAIINEGDMLLKAPNREQIMAELRDLYSGFARCFYRNGKQMTYNNLRITMILAGTPTLRQLNRSALGDRFLDCVVYKQPKGSSSKDEVNMLDSVIAMQIARCRAKSNGSLESFDQKEKVEAKQRTSGYVNWLRANVEEQVGKVEVSQQVIVACRQLGQLVAVMRTRPGGGDEDETEPELPTRLGEQFARLSLCLAVALNRQIDAEVMRRVASVARDTCYGNTLTVSETLALGPLDSRGIAVRTSLSETKVRNALEILVSIGCVKIDNTTSPSGAKRRTHIYRLSPQTAGLLSKMRSLIGG